MSAGRSCKIVTVRTIKKYVGRALLQDRPGGRIRAAKSDRLVRYVQITGPYGPIEITAHGSKEASDAAKYDAAVNRYLRGDLKALAPWHGKKIGGVELITAGPALKGLAQKELLPHSLYRALSGGVASIEAACSHAKYSEGPAAYDRCLAQQLAAWTAGPRQPDLSRLTFGERQSIEAACSHAKYSEGPAAYDRCLIQQLEALGNYHQ